MSALPTEAGPQSGSAEKSGSAQLVSLFDLHAPEVANTARPSLVDHQSVLAPADLDRILKLARYVPVFPCSPNDKHPRTKNGFKDATRDEATIRGCWSRWPDSLVGVPMGKASGLFCLDFDSYKASPVSTDWVVSKTAILLATRVHTTARGGRHYLFRQPEGIETKTAAHLSIEGVKLDAIDIRGDGGYIIWWPLHGLHGEGNAQPMPEEFINLFRRNENRGTPSPLAVDEPAPEQWTRDQARVAAALAHCDPTEHDQWIQFGMAIHLASGGTEASFGLWHAWSNGSLTGSTPVNYTGEADCRRRWQSFHHVSDRPVTLGTIFARAAKHGFTQSGRAPGWHGHSNGELQGQDWVAPTPLPDGLPPVAAFDYELLPPVLHKRVADIAERMQCPPDFPAVAVMVMLASLVGRRCRVAPKRADDWIIVPNLWGMVIGRPGIMKSPPLTEIMRPLQVLQAQAIDRFERDQADYQANSMVAVEGERVAKERIRKLLKERKRGDAADVAREAVEKGEGEPVCRRYVVNDSTVEKLGEILNQNPPGVLLFRDELNGFFRTLERQGHEADRAFYLECWNGDSSFTYDRIGRGTLHIPGACLSVLGSIQPGPLSDLVRGLRGSGDDGLLQRFQLAVWPDASREWVNVDRPPDRAARDALQQVIERFDRMAPATDIEAAPVVRFNDEAQELFDSWRKTLERRLRSDTEHPMLEAHLAKYRSLVPSLALIIWLTDSDSGPVECLALERAIAWVEYLETHARRIYAPAISPDMDAARALAKRIGAGDIASDFALRDIYNRGWSGLGTRDEVASAVEVLVDHDWLREAEEATTGRPRTYYRINPATLPNKDPP